ncbi:hypothetical protein BDB01DRAFT_136611 [Pilobolus umbonatus]|nr:hypothetical protein BDB01DRAFT_136611 [Pilobolus umbonatus]
MVSSNNPSKHHKHKTSKSAKYEHKLKKIKLTARSEIDLFDWQKWKFYKKDYWIDPYVDTVPRIDYRYVSKKEFIDRFEAKNIPVVITHATDEWRAHKYWSTKFFRDNYGSNLFKVGDDDHNENVYMKMKYFLRYSHHEGLKDDSPLYIFDSGFDKNRLSKHKIKKSSGSKKKRRSLLDDYHIPRYFAEDFFKLTGNRRPPYKWLVMGGGRSGTGIHIDPLGTSAWNSLLKGHKRWCLFPPLTPKELYNPPTKPYDKEGISWFDQVFPKMKVKDASGKTLGERLGMLEVLQKPGETIFVPGGWPHVVINLDFTIAVTQNFCSSTNLEYVYLSTRYSRPKLGLKLYREIQKLGQKDHKYKDLAVSLESLKFTPRLPPSSSDSDSASSTSSSSSSNSNGDDRTTSMKRKKVSSTESETDQSDGTCMCKKCKLKRKKISRYSQ